MLGAALERLSTSSRLDRSSGPPSLAHHSPTDNNRNREEIAASPPAQRGQNREGLSASLAISPVPHHQRGNSTAYDDIDPSFLASIASSPPHAGRTADAGGSYRALAEAVLGSSDLAMDPGIKENVRSRVSFVDASIFLCTRGIGLTGI
jgi:hypothetical protein